MSYHLLALLVLDEADLDLVLISGLDFGTVLLLDLDLVLRRVILSKLSNFDLDLVCLEHSSFDSTFLFLLEPFLFTPSNLVDSNRGALIEESSFSILLASFEFCTFC